MEDQPLTKASSTKRRHEYASENAPAKRRDGKYRAEPTFGQRMAHLKFDTIKLVNDMDGVTHECSFSFDRLSRPHIISILGAHRLPPFDFSKPDKRPTLFNCPCKVAGLWMQAMFQKAEEVAKHCKALCSERELSGETYHCNSCHLEFHIGQRMTSRSWHSHITLPLHAYFLYRWNHFATAKLSPHSSERVLVDEESWSTYVDCRHQFLVELTSKHEKYQERDAASIADTLKSLEEEERTNGSACEKEPCRDAKDEARVLGDGQRQSPILLSTQQETKLGGYHILYTFDPDCAGNPVVGLCFPEVDRFDTSTASALGDVASAVSVFCKQFGFADLQVFVFKDNTIRLVVDISSFMRHLSLSDAQVWAKRWHTPCADGRSPTARATQADLNELNRAGPRKGRGSRDTERKREQGHRKEEEVVN